MTDADEAILIANQFTSTESGQKIERRAEDAIHKVEDKIVHAASSTTPPTSVSRQSTTPRTDSTLSSSAGDLVRQAESDVERDGRKMMNDTRDKYNEVKENVREGAKDGKERMDHLQEDAKAQVSLPLTRPFSSSLSLLPLASPNTD